MKALILNGSPRKGNTKTAADIMAASLEDTGVAENVEVIDVAELNISGCRGCGGCQAEGADGCVIDDDGRIVGEKVVAADIVIFATPVYWWGVTAQLKLAIDRLYGQGAKLGGKKKIGTVAIGEAELDDPEYGFIRDQFGSICNYLGWEYVFSKSIKAGAADDLLKDIETVEELNRIGELF